MAPDCFRMVGQKSGFAGKSRVPLAKTERREPQPIRFHRPPLPRGYTRPRIRRSTSAKSAAAARRRPTGRAGVAEKSRLITTPARTRMSATTNPRRSLRMRTWRLGAPPSGRPAGRMRAESMTGPVDRESGRERPRRVEAVPGHSCWSRRFQRLEGGAALGNRRSASA